MTANFADSEFLGVKIKRGQLACSYSELADTLKLSERNIRTALDHLKATGQVTVERHPKFSVVTLVGYNRYQAADTRSDRRLTPDRHPTDNQVTPDRQQEKKNKKNNKNNKNNKEEEYSACARTYVREGSVSVYQETADDFNRLCPSLSPVKNLTSSRLELLDKLFATYSRDTIREIFAKAEKSSFLRGEKNKDGRDWQATFDWLIDPDNAVKTLEGLYDDKEGANAESRKKGNYDFEAFEKMAQSKLLAKR